MASESIREWLDADVKAGYGAKFASAFEEVGFEDTSDLQDMDDELMANLEQELVAADAKAVHLKKIKAAINAVVGNAPETRANLDAAKSTEVSTAETATSAAVVAAKEKRRSSSKPFAAFLSHHKLACAMEARYLKSELERALGAEIFLDSDDLKDLRKLGQHVVDSDVLVLLQSSDVLLRPWCVYELHTAIDAGIPIVAVMVASKGYDFADAGQLMLHLDTLLEARNPGASKVLNEVNVDLKTAAWKLSSTVPNVISVPFNPSASQNAIAASVLDLIEGIRSAHPVPLEKTLDAWLAARGTSPVSANQHGAAPSGTDSGVCSTGMTPLPPEVPELPRGYLVRKTILTGIKELLFPGTSAVEQPQAITVAVQGMGGSGKTVTAAALVFDKSVRGRFDVVVFLPFGQTPVLRDLQKTMHFQLVKKSLDGNCSDDEVLEALRVACKDRKVLCVLDDVWTKEAYQPFARLLDDATDSRLLVTTRVKGLVPGAPEFALGLLSPDDSVSLLMECAGEKAGTPPHDKLLYDAVELCGHLPLVLSIGVCFVRQEEKRLYPNCVTLCACCACLCIVPAAAGILEQQHGGIVNESFIELLSADHAEALREGELGDEMVSIEDRLITASLNSYTGKDKSEVEALFLKLAVFPEDVPVPVSVFDALASLWAGRDTKRPHLKVRSWLTALLRCSLAVGSLTDGVYQHDSE